MPNWNPRDLLVITTYIRQTQIHRVLIDNGSSIDILYEHWFRERPTTFKQGLKQSTRGPLFGFTGHQLQMIGTIHLLVTIVTLGGKPPSRHGYAPRMTRALLIPGHTIYDPWHNENFHKHQITNDRHL